MSKPSIETQVQKWLEGRGRWLRSGGDNLVRYLSVMLQRGDQVEALRSFLLADELPDWLYVERDAHRVTLIGLDWWRDDKAVEYDEVLQDAWEIVADLYSRLGRVQRDLAKVQAALTEREQLLGVTSQTAEAVVLDVAPDACDHAAIERELAVNRQKVVALESVNSNNQQVIANQQNSLRSMRGELKKARQSAAIATAERQEVTRALFELLYLVIREPVLSDRAYELVAKQFKHFINLFRRVLDKSQSRSARLVLERLTV